MCRIKEILDTHGDNTIFFFCYWWFLLDFKRGISFITMSFHWFPLMMIRSYKKILEKPRNSQLNAFSSTLVNSTITTNYQFRFLFHNHQLSVSLSTWRMRKIPNQQHHNSLAFGWPSLLFTDDAWIVFWMNCLIST